MAIAPMAKYRRTLAASSGGIGWKSYWFIFPLFDEKRAAKKEAARRTLNQTQNKKLWRGQDLNLRPLGYEPNELTTALPHDVCRDLPPGRWLNLYNLI